MSGIAQLQRVHAPLNPKGKVPFCPVMPAAASRHDVLVLVRALILGSEGFVGRNLIPHLLDKDFYVTGIDRRPQRNVSHRGFEFRCEDAADRRFRLFRSAELPDIVINLAAESYVHDSFSRPRAHLRANARIPVLVSEALSATQTPPWLVHFSTCEVYGDCPEEGADENRLPAPMTPYAATKLAGEQIVAAYSRAACFPSTILRPFNLFGPHQQANRLIPSVAAAMRSRAPVTLHGSGHQVRDWIGITELLQILDLLIERGPAMLLETTNLSAHRPLSVIEVVREVAEALCIEEYAVDTKILGQPQMQRSVDASTESRELLGWHPTMSFQELLQPALARSRAPQGGEGFSV